MPPSLVNVGDGAFDHNPIRTVTMTRNMHEWYGFCRGLARPLNGQTISRVRAPVMAGMPVLLLNFGKIKGSNLR